MAKRIQKDWPLFESVPESEKPYVWPSYLKQLADSSPKRGSSLEDVVRAERVMYGIHGDNLGNPDMAIPASHWIDFAMVCRDDKLYDQAMSAVDDELEGLTLRAQSYTETCSSSRVMNPNLHFNPDIEEAFKSLKQSMCRIYGKTARVRFAEPIARVYATHAKCSADHYATTATFMGSEGMVMNMGAAVFDPDSVVLDVCTDLLMGGYIDPRYLAQPVDALQKMYGESMKYTHPRSVANAFDSMYRTRTLSLPRFAELYEKFLDESRASGHDIGNVVLGEEVFVQSA